MSSEHSTDDNGVNGKFCIGYNIEKHWCPLTEFYSDMSRADGLSCICKLCSKNKHRDYGKTPNGKIKWRESRKRQREEAKRIREELKINGCAICGYDKCINALSFHHTNPDDKKFNPDVQHMAYSTERLVEEVNKCILLCSNCHREIHYKERGGK